MTGDGALDERGVAGPPGADPTPADPGAPAATDPLTAIADQLFFIVGCGRSGTSLLQVMIASHPEITLPNETGFYTMLRRRYRRRWGELRRPEAFAAALDTTLDFWRIRELSLDGQRVRELAKTRQPSWETIFLAILAALAEQRGVERVGEKTPANIRYLGDLSERFPRARFIHMVRDPRAVAASRLEVRSAGRLLGVGCRNWRQAIAQHRRYQRALGERYLVVRYEELVSDPAATLRTVCGFLGCDFSAAMLAHDRRRHPGFAPRQLGHMANTLKPVFTDSVDKWRRSLTPGQVGLIERNLEAEMELMGYPPTGHGTLLPRTRYRLHLAAFSVLRAWRWLAGAMTRGGTGERSPARD